MPLLLSDDDMEKLILMLGYGMPDGFTQEDFEVLVRWAEEIRLAAASLENVLSGHLCVVVRGGEVLFRTTAAGDREVEAMIAEAGARTVVNVV